MSAAQDEVVSARSSELMNAQLRLERRIEGLPSTAHGLRAIQQEMSACRQALFDLSSMVDDFVVFAHEQRTIEATQTLLEVAKQHEREHARLVERLRHSYMRAKINLGQEQERERSQLLDSDVKGNATALRRRKLKRDALKTAEKGTLALTETRNALAAELERMNATKAVLQEGHAVVKETIHQHRLYDGLVKVGRGMLNVLRRRDRTDKMLLLFGVLVFVLVVVYIVGARMPKPW